eukprot:746229-Hanusia_phi.AAC.13
MKKMLSGLFGRGKGAGTKSSQISKTKASSSEENSASEPTSNAKSVRKSMDKDNLENEGSNLPRRKSLSLRGSEPSSDPNTPTGESISDVERKKFRFRQQVSVSSFNLNAEEKPRPRAAAFSSSMNRPRRQSLPIYINPKSSYSTGCLSDLVSDSVDTSDETCKIHRPEDVDDVMLARLVQEETKAMEIVKGFRMS